MSQEELDQPRRGCYGWVISIKKSVDERLARARNALRRKLARKNKSTQPLTPDNIEHETGSPDLIITRVRTPSANGEIRTDQAKSPLPGVPDHAGQIQMTTKSEERQDYIGCTLDGNPDPEQVKTFVQSIIQSAENEVNITRDIVTDETASLTSSILSVMANEAVTQSLTNIVHDLAEESNMAAVDDTDSLSSGAISDLAEAAVSASLTKIMNDPEGEIIED